MDIKALGATRKASASGNFGRCYIAPKRPPAAFFLFTKDANATIGNTPTRDELLEIQCSWRDMAIERKMAYERVAKALRLKYESDVHDFKAHGRYDSSAT